MIGKRCLGLTSLLLLGVLTAAPALAEDEVTVSAVIYREAGATAADASIVSIGLRRGLSGIPGVDFVHPVDVLSTREYSMEVQDAIDELEPLADMVRTGDARAAYRRADEIARLFEDHLDLVRRSQLVDAYMLAAIGRCRAGRMEDCEERIRQIIAFREGLQYDADRYGSEWQEVFDRARVRALSGARGELSVQTEPAGAEVYLDGRSYGPSPVNAQGLLAGNHYITIKELGYEEKNVRARVEGGEATTETYQLTPNERSQLIIGPEAQAAVRAELGERRAGDNIRSVGNTLGVTQLILGVLRPAAGSQVHVQLYLYHMHTRLLQNQVEATLSTDEAGMERARQLALELYQGVDLSGAIQAPDEGTAPEQSPVEPELWEHWWFWLAVAGAAVLVAGAIGAGVALGGQQSVPSGFLRFSGTLP